MTGRTWFTTSVIISLLYATWCAMWSTQIGYNQAPDEVTHFFLIEYLYKFGQIPRPGIDPVHPYFGALTGQRFIASQFWYYGLPFVHSIGAATMSWILDPITPKGSGYLAARSFNWIMAGWFVFSQIQIASIMMRKRTYMVAAVGMLPALIPQVTFVFSYMNSDGFGLACTSLMILGLSAVIERGRLRHYALLGVGAGLSVITKLYFYPVILYAVITLIFTYIFNSKSINYNGLCLAVFSAGVVSLPFIVLTYHHFGEFTGAKGQLDFVRMHQNDPGAGYGTCYVFCKNSIANYKIIWLWLKTLWQSFFGVFGWMSIWLPNAVYLIVFLPISFVAIIFSGIVIIRALISGDYMRGFAIFLYWAMFSATVIFALIASQTLLPQAQGRYAFAAVPLVAFIIAMGRRSFQSQAA